MTSMLRATACYCGQPLVLAMARRWAIFSLMLAELVGLEACAARGNSRRWSWSWVGGIPGAGPSIGSGEVSPLALMLDRGNSRRWPWCWVGGILDQLGNCQPEGHFQPSMSAPQLQGHCQPEGSLRTASAWFGLCEIPTIPRRFRGPRKRRTRKAPDPATAPGSARSRARSQTSQHSQREPRQALS